MAKNTNTPTLMSVINRQLDMRINNMGGALPGTVVSFDAGSDTCVVRPGVNRSVPVIGEDDFVFEELPPVYDVPVCWPQGRNFRFNGTLNAGDHVLLVCLDRDASGWLRPGKPSDPDDVRESSWANAVAIPGLVPSTNPFNPTDSAALASKLDALIAALKTVKPGAASDTAVVVGLKFPNVSGSTSPDPSTTTGSSTLKLGG